MTENPELSAGRPSYRYYVAWTISGALALELNFTGVTWSRQVRRAGTFSGTVSFDSGDGEGPDGETNSIGAERLAEAFWGTMPGRMSIYVTRDGVAVWGGIISRRSYDAAGRTLTVEANGFEAYLYRRLIWHTTSYPNTVDQYQVVRNLIALMETDFASVAVSGDHADPHPDNANIGIDVDPSNSGHTQDAQTWAGYELTTFGDAIEVFSDNLHGFEYNIEVGFNDVANKFTKQLVFREAPPSQLPVGVEYTGQRPGLEENFFEYPGNIIGIGYDDTIDDAGTRTWVAGAQPEPIGEVEQPKRLGVWENEAYLSTQWPVLEVVESSDHANVTVQATLDTYARSYGQRAKPPLPSWSVAVNGSMNPQVGSYNPGDWCRMLIRDPFLVQAIDSAGEFTRAVTKRIAAFSVSVPDTEQKPETVTLTLIDEWNDGDGGA